MRGVGLAFEPLDTLFFRDATPFTLGAAPQEDVGSVFPPGPATIVGAVRAALARHAGWHGHGKWPEKLNEVLGDGPADLGCLRFTGPWVLLGNEPLFALPHHLLGRAQNGQNHEPPRWQTRAFLKPANEVCCDLGDGVLLPEASLANSPTGERIGPPEPGRWWVTAEGLQAVLEARPPEPAQVLHASALWSHEPRIGLQRDAATRTAVEGMLYSTRHVRLKDGVRLGVQVAGLPGEWPMPDDDFVPLGGESRTAVCRRWKPRVELRPPWQAIEASGKVALIGLTPLDLEPDVIRGERPLAEPCRLRVLSACLTRPLRLGGWDSLARRPLTLRSVLAPGSVLFCACDEPAELRGRVGEEGWTRIGNRCEWGFGLVAVGRWPDEQESRT